MDDIWIRGIGFLLLSLGVPAVVISLSWPPARDDDIAGGAERLLIGMGVPLAVLVVASEEFARLGWLRSEVVWAYAILATTLALAVGIHQRERIRSRVRHCLHPGELLSRFGAIVALLGAASADASLAIRRADSFTAPTSWYYWQLSVDIGRAGRIPRWAEEWGTSVHFFDYHLGFNALGAALGLATGDPHSLIGAQLIRIATAVGAIVGLALLARVFGAPRFAAVAVGIVVPCVEIFDVKFASFRPESTAYFLMLATPALFYRWLQHGGRARLVALVAVFVGVSQLHTPVAIVAFVFCTALALAQIRRSWRCVGAIAGVLFLLLASSLVVDQVTGHRGPLSAGFATPPTLAHGTDPTFVFNQLAGGRLGTPTDLGSDAPSSSDLLGKTMQQGFTVGGNTSYAIALGLVLALAIGAVAVRRFDVIRLVVSAFVMMVALIVVAYVTSLTWKTYVPLRTGYSRLLQIWWFAPLSVIALLPTLTRRSWLRVATTTALFGLACTLWVLTLRTTLGHSDLQPSRTTLQSLRSLTDLEVKPKSTILTNAYTQDFVRYNVGVNGLLDGRAPYLEAALLKRANKILDLTGSYMADPFTHPFPFAKYHVRYVLAGTAPFALGTPAVFPTDIGKLRLDPTLAVVQEGPGYTLFKVRDPGV